MIETFIRASPINNIEIDTAILYSAGETEKIIGRILPTVEGAEKLQLATKANPWAGDDGATGGLAPAKLRAQLETSLESLGVSQVHLFYLHAPDLATPLVDTLREVDALYKEGKFVEFGLSNFSAWETTYAYHLCTLNGWIKVRENEIIEEG